MESYTVECLLPDGQCLQLATSHYFGDNFCRAMNVKFQSKKQSKEEQLQYPFSTSWGTSTRAIGALALSHVDSLGLILPFDVAPVQIAFILVGENEELINYYQEILETFTFTKYRCRLYNQNKQVNLNILQADKEGCPLKIILGPEELEEGKITLKRRDNIKNKITINIAAKSGFEAKLFPLFEDYAEKLNKISLEEYKKNAIEPANIKEQMIESVKKGHKQGKIFKAITQAREELNKNLYQKSVNFRDQHIFSVREYQELEKKIKGGVVGLFLIPFCNNLSCEETIPSKLPAYSIRCLSLTEKPKEGEKCIFCAFSTDNYAYLGRSY